MKEHHIGKEIGKEVRKQNLSEVINGEVDELCIIQSPVRHSMSIFSNNCKIITKQ